MTYKQKLIDLLKTIPEIKEDLEELRFGCNVFYNWEYHILYDYKNIWWKDYINIGWWLSEEMKNEYWIKEVIWNPLEERHIRIFSENKEVYICITTSWYICWTDIEKPICQIDNSKSFDYQTEEFYKELFNFLNEKI